MRKPIFTALSPNAQRDDILLTFRLLFQPWKWRDGKKMETLKSIFKEWLPAENVYLFESGRTSLYAILSALDLQKEDEVLLQSYTCVAVPEPVLWVGAKPVYVDVDETFTMNPVDFEQKISSKSKVLIIQHTFGQPADLNKLLEIAKKNDLFVIEDCAHALGSLYEGKKVGTFGDASFFSFGRDKIISSVFGGVLTVKDKTLALKVNKFYESCRLPSLGWIYQQLLHPVVVGFSKWTHNIYVGKIFLNIVKKFNILSKEVYQVERQGGKPPFLKMKFPNGLAILALHQFEKLDHYNAHRRELAEFYHYELEKLPFKFQVEVKDTKSVYLRYILRSEHAQDIIKKAKEEDIYLGDWYTLGIAPEGVNYQKVCYDPSGCPVAEQLAEETLNLPTHIGITKIDAKRIMEFLFQFAQKNRPWFT